MEYGLEGEEDRNVNRYHMVPQGKSELSPGEGECRRIGTRG